MRAPPPPAVFLLRLDVSYIYGRTESTDGALWVVGKDHELFDYFLPERWEKTPRTKLSSHHETYYTVSKDNIHLVWKLSNTGFVPEMDPFKADEKKGACKRNRSRNIFLIMGITARSKKSALPFILVKKESGQFIHGQFI